MPHTRWKGIKPIPNQHLSTIQLSYIRGYILALEDVLRDLDNLPVDSATFTVIYADVVQTLESAKQTFDALGGNERYEDLTNDSE